MSRQALNETAPALHMNFHKSHTSKLAVGLHNVNSHALSSLDFHKSHMSKSAVEFHNADSHALLSLEFNNLDSHETLSLG